jgi:hypothetical protein
VVAAVAPVSELGGEIKSLRFVGMLERNLSALSANINSSLASSKP